MALMKCAACSREISQEALACPGCGHPAPKRTSGFTKFVAGVLAFGAGLLVLGGLASDPVDKPRAHEPAACPTGDAGCALRTSDGRLHVNCKEAIERRAKFNARWTDGMLNPAFSRAAWTDEPTGVLTVGGDEVEFQNEVGNFLPTSYVCEYDVIAHKVLDVRTWPGKWRDP